MLHIIFFITLKDQYFPAVDVLKDSFCHSLVPIILIEIRCMQFMSVDKSEAVN